MKKALVICSLLVFGALKGECSVPFFAPLQPQAPNYSSSANDPFVKNTYVPSPSVNYPRINQIETAIFGQIYANQDITYRLARLEKSIFSTTYPNLSFSQRVDNIVANFNKINDYPDISKIELNNIENMVFGKNYSSYGIQERIENLERKLLGAVQAGDMLSRYETIKVASKNNNRIVNPSYPNYYQNSNLASRPKGLKGVLGAIGTFLLGGGTMTGFSPPLDPYNSYNNYNSYNSGYSPNYSSGYNNPNFMNMGGNMPGSGVYRGTRTNTGWVDDYSSYGSGSRVTILD